MSETNKAVVLRFGKFMGLKGPGLFWIIPVVDTVTEQTLAYTTNSNRLATHNGNAVTLDSAGNTTADVEEDVSFVYDDHNRMV